MTKLGPWRRGKDKFNILSDHPREIVAQVYSLSKNHKANGDLIVAAPELLEALRIAMIQMKADMACRIQQPIEKECNLKIMEVMQDAIDKAEGRKNE